MILKCELGWEKPALLLREPYLASKTVHTITDARFVIFHFMSLTTMHTVTDVRVIAFIIAHRAKVCFPNP